jgi:hypothetical protein
VSDAVLLPREARALRHRRSRNGFKASWAKIRKTLYSPRILQGLPPFAEPIAKAVWETDIDDVVRAVRSGDVAFFVAWQLRLDQLDCAMVNAGRTIADRAPLVRIKYLMQGFRDAAEKRLKTLGGSWPPAVED